MADTEWTTIEEINATMNGNTQNFVFASASEQRAHIFRMNDIVEKLLFVPEWKTTILLRSLSGAQRAAIMKAAVGSDGQPDIKKMYEYTVYHGCYHPQTKERLFDFADRDAFMQKNGAVIERIAVMLNDVSGLTQSSAIEAEKN